MRRLRAGDWASALAVVSMLTAPPLSAAEQASVETRAGRRAIDVALDAKQTFNGRVVTLAGEPVPAAVVSLQQRDKLVARTVADRSGRFHFRVPRGGAFSLLSDGQVTPVRIWTGQAAPPDSRRHLVVVQEKRIVRGQDGTFPYAAINPWVVAGLVAIAVAIPVALHNDRSDRGDGS